MTVVLMKVMTMIKNLNCVALACADGHSLMLSCLILGQRKIILELVFNYQLRGFVHVTDFKTFAILKSLH